MSGELKKNIKIRPIVRFPRHARAGRSYLMTVDLRHDVLPGNWPYDREEYPVTCLLDTLPLFEHKALGDATLILHRFGGTYGEVRFLLKASEQEMEGGIRITLVNESGIPIQTIEVSAVHVDHKADVHKVEEVEPISIAQQLRVEEDKDTDDTLEDARLIVVRDGLTLQLVVRLPTRPRSKMIT
jgi:hypothetical protein